jgi:ribosomal protein L32
MAVQQNKKSPSKRGMHRAHLLRLLKPQLVRLICATTFHLTATIVVVKWLKLKTTNFLVETDRSGSI